MMDLSVFNLIQESESVEMYRFQQELLKNINHNNGENAIKLALLMTLSPIGDYEEALKILSYSSNFFFNAQLEIIKCYFMLKWGKGIENGYIQELLSEREYDSETESIFYYLLALQLEQSGRPNEVFNAISISVEKCSDHVNNLLMYAKYLKNNESWCHQKAKMNYKRIDCSNINAYIDPSIFIGEYISGIYRADHGSVS